MGAAARSATGEAWDGGGGEGVQDHWIRPAEMPLLSPPSDPATGAPMPPPLSLEKLDGKGMGEGVEDRRIHPSKLSLLPPPLDPSM